MGIEPWIMRAPPQTLIARGVKLLVIVDVADKASLLLTKMLHSIGLLEADICIVPTLTGDVTQHLATLHPQLLLALGDGAVKCLHDETLSLDAMRSKTHNYLGVPLVFSYHPNDLLQNPSHKKNAYQDLLLVQQLLVNEPC